ncbi:uncharacterized protein LOC124210076 isoform X1 [Daphnia pulex]|uniref:uncharacterized protein LOC124210076 isoform X1 n=1 Tax=Daphnia pulex TaxID=6669 RepID=UPI001EE1410C|nr:uncharacterized protein LOC124210076 isoform X1 [Daphnia pulex]
MIIYPAPTVFNYNSSYCASPMEKYLPIEIMYDGRMGYGCCWGPNEFPWTPYCIVDSPMTPYCMYDVSSINSTLSELSISSSEGDCCCSPESLVSSTPSSNSHKKVSRVDQQDAENIWRFPKTAPPPIPLPGWNPLPYGLERFWKNSFLWLFIELYENNHLWTLKPVEKPPIEDGKGTPWETVIHSAKVRFNCEMANHGWTSMQGRVVFWFRILYGIESGFVRGEVVFKLYGQKCERCTSGAFETALWYPEEIANAMWNLYSKVAEKFYGRPVDKVVRGLRGGKPRTPHKPELCQSCSDGLPCGKP